jgi:protein required for attachment to host cells
MEKIMSSLVLVAPAAFLGVLRNRLEATTLESVVLELNKDIVHLDARAIRARLPEFLPRR